MKILEFHCRIIKKWKSWIPTENHENQENLRIPYENHDNHGNPKVLKDNTENHEKS